MPTIKEFKKLESGSFMVLKTWDNTSTVFFWTEKKIAKLPKQKHNSVPTIHIAVSLFDFLQETGAPYPKNRYSTMT